MGKNFLTQRQVAGFALVLFILQACVKPSMERLSSFNAAGGGADIISGNTTGQLKALTLAGNGVAGNDYGYGTAATMKWPGQMAVDKRGNIYFADRDNHQIRFISTYGFVYVKGGNGKPGFADGGFDQSQFSYPTAVAVDDSFNVYVADCGNQRIRKIDQNNVTTTIAGIKDSGFTNGPASTAQFHNPSGIAVLKNGTILVADAGNQVIRSISKLGNVGTYAGNGSSGTGGGTGAFAQFNYPVGLAVDTAGNVYVADSANNQIRKITPGRTVSRIAGDSTGLAGNANGGLSAGRLSKPVGVTVDLSGSVFVADMGNNQVRKITAAGVLSSFAGNGSANFADGIATQAAFNKPSGIVVDSKGNVYVGDGGNRRIRAVGFLANVSTLAGGVSGYQDGTGKNAKFGSPAGVTMDAAGNIYISDTYYSDIRKITPSGVVTWFAGSNTGSFINFGWVDGSLANARFNSPMSISIGSTGSIYVADMGNNRIRVIAGGQVSTLAGNSNQGFSDGKGAAATFNQPYGVSADKHGNVYVADAGNQRIRKIDAAGNVITFAGSGTAGYAEGHGTLAAFSFPYAVTVDATDNVYVADFYNRRIRKITPAGDVSTLAGTGASGTADGPAATATFLGPESISVDGAGNLYVMDYGSYIRKISTDGAVTTVAGQSSTGYSDVLTPFAEFWGLGNVAVNPSGNIIYVTETGNHTVRQIQ